MIRATIRAPEGLRVLSGSARSADLPTVSIATIFNELFRQFAVLSSLRHSITIISSTGILTRCPSATPFGLTLGPDSPSADEPCRRKP